MSRQKSARPLAQTTQGTASPYCRTGDDGAGGDHAALTRSVVGWDQVPSGPLAQPGALSDLVNRLPPSGLGLLQGPHGNVPGLDLGSSHRLLRYLGLGLQPVAIDGGKELGAMVMSVDPQGPGVTAGIHQGDILVAWNDQPIRHVHTLLRALGPDSVGQAATLQLRRAGETQQVSITIAERPVA